MIAKTFLVKNDALIWMPVEATPVTVNQPVARSKFKRKPLCSEAHTRRNPHNQSFKQECNKYRMKRI